MIGLHFVHKRIEFVEGKINKLLKFQEDLASFFVAQAPFVCIQNESDQTDFLNGCSSQRVIQVEQFRLLFGPGRTQQKKN